MSGLEPHLLLDLVCNRPLNAMVAQAITYYNVLAGRVGSMGMIQPASAELPFLMSHNEQMDERRALVQALGQANGIILKPNNSRFAGNMVQAEDGSWRKVEPYTITPDGTAIIHVIGALVNRGAYVGSSSGVTSYEGIDFSLTRAANDRRVKGIVLDIASPGGESAGNDEIARKIFAIREVKPVLGVANAMAASAGYAMLAACTEAYGTASSLVGSIGCIMLHLDKTEQAKNEGVVPTIIHAGARKADGHAYNSLTPDALDRLKAGVNSYYGLFVKSVGAGRGEKLTAKMARETEADTFVGKEAKTAGLLDDIATFEQVLSASDHDNRKRSRRSAQSKEGSPTMSTLVSQMMGAAPQPENAAPIAPQPGNIAEPQFINGVWMVPLANAPQPVAPVPPNLAAPALDPRITAAAQSPVFQALPQIQGAVLAALRTNPTMSADQAIAQMTATLGGPAAPPAPAAPSVPAPIAAAPVPAGLPAPPPGYAYATMPNGTLGFVPVAGQQAAAIAGRVDATGVNNLPAAHGGASPTGVPTVPGQPQAAVMHDGYLPGDVKGSIKLEDAPWDAHIKRANMRVAGFREPKVHGYIEHDPQA